MIGGINLRFYDAKNDCGYCVLTLKRDSLRYNNNKLYEGKWPQWALDAYPKLEK